MAKPHSRNIKGKPSVNSVEIHDGAKQHLEDLMPYLRENIPESTACAMIGLDYEVWNGYCVRFPALRLAAKRAQAERLVEWQRTVEAGAQGWQAAATLLERRDPANWSRSYSPPKQTKAGLAGAIPRASKKRG